MLKKFISVFLCTVIFTVNVIFMPYATTVYASDFVGNVVKSISFDNVVKMVKSLYKVGYNVAATGSGDGAASSKALDSIWGEDSAVNKWLQTKLFPFMDTNRNIDLTKDDCPISYDNEKQLVEFNPTFTTELNQQLQDSIHALDGYYLIDSDDAILSFDDIFDKYWSRFTKPSGDALTKIHNVWAKINCRTVFVNFSGSNVYISYYDPACYTGASNAPSDCNLAFYPSNNIAYYKNSKNIFSGSSVGYRNSDYYLKPQTFSIPYQNNFLKLYSKKESRDGLILGDSVKYFYSRDDYFRYLNQGRTYVPQLPSGGFKINIKYINNSVNYPDVNINLDSLVGKVEADVQADLNLTLKNYLDHLADFTDGGGGTTNPTPTPSGGGSGGDFGDGATPTPKPDFTDGSLTDTNTLLQKILDKLTEFSANHDKLAKTISDYIEKNDGKLEEILLAIQALSDGKTETEQNGCKYDFTALSEYLTKLWNDSDQKFDEMVKLLEENNKYQQKLVDSLNEIKALLIADTVMDFFKDRSQETAEKAKDKFPTSIPWDISLVLNSMSAEPKNPKFSLPIKIESFKINETIDIDLSTDEWEKLAKTCRYILSVTFILFLIHLSRKLFSNGGDD